MKKLILSAAFLTIGTFSFAQQYNKMQKRDPAKMEQKRADNMKQMQKDLNLNEAQMAKIKSLQDKRVAERMEMMPQKQAQRKAKMEMMQAKRDQQDAEMKQILTAEQYQKWQVIRQDKMQDNRQMMKAKRMNRQMTN